MKKVVGDGGQRETLLLGAVALQRKLLCVQEDPAGNSFIFKFQNTK